MPDPNTITEEYKSLKCVELGLILLARPHCRHKDQLLDKIIANLTAAGIDPNGELWMRFVARVIKNMEYGPANRDEMLGPCRDALDVLFESCNA